MNNLGYILGLIIFVWSVYDIWTGKMDQGKKVLWTIVCFFLSFIGTIIYVLVGRKK